MLRTFSERPAFFRMYTAKDIHQIALLLDVILGDAKVKHSVSSRNKKKVVRKGSCRAWLR